MEDIMSLNTKALIDDIYEKGKKKLQETEKQKDILDAEASAYQEAAKDIRAMLREKKYREEEMTPDKIGKLLCKKLNIFAIGNDLSWEDMVDKVVENLHKEYTLLPKTTIADCNKKQKEETKQTTTDKSLKFNPASNTGLFVEYEMPNAKDLTQKALDSRMLEEQIDEDK